MITTLDIFLRAQRNTDLKNRILAELDSPQPTYLEDGIHRLIFDPKQQEVQIQPSDKVAFGSHKLAPASLSYTGVKELLDNNWQGDGLKTFKLLLD